MDQKVLIGVVGVGIVVFLILFIFISPQNDSREATPQESNREIQESSAPTDHTQVAPRVAGISFQDGKFAPNPMRIETQSTVQLYINNSSSETIDLVGASESSPLNVGQILAGQNKQVELREAGEYSFYNRLNPQQKGTIEVTVTSQ
jgi:hypothetical protein